MNLLFLEHLLDVGACLIFQELRNIIILCMQVLQQTVTFTLNFF